MQRQVQKLILSSVILFWPEKRFSNSPFLLLSRINFCIWRILLTEFCSKGNIPGCSKGLAGIRRKMRIEDFSFLTSEIVGRKKERVEERTEKWSGMCLLVSPFVGSDGRVEVGHTGKVILRAKRPDSVKKKKNEVTPTEAK